MLCTTALLRLKTRSWDFLQRTSLVRPVTLTLGHCTLVWTGRPSCDFRHSQLCGSIQKSDTFLTGPARNRAVDSWSDRGHQLACRGKRLSERIALDGKGARDLRRRPDSVYWGRLGSHPLISLGQREQVIPLLTMPNHVFTLIGLDRKPGMLVGPPACHCGQSQTARDDVWARPTSVGDLCCLCHCCTLSLIATAKMIVQCNMALDKA